MTRTPALQTVRRELSYLPESTEVEEGSGAGGRDFTLWMKGGEQVSREPDPLVI